MTNKKINEFFKDERSLMEFKENIQKYRVEFEKLAKSTIAFLELCYRDRTREVFSLKKRQIGINNFLSQWAKFVKGIDGLRDEICEICDYGDGK